MSEENFDSAFRLPAPAPRKSKIGFGSGSASLIFPIQTRQFLYRNCEKKVSFLLRGFLKYYSLTIASTLSKSKVANLDYFSLNLTKNQSITIKIGIWDNSFFLNCFPVPILFIIISVAKPVDFYPVSHLGKNFVSGSTFKNKQNTGITNFLNRHDAGIHSWFLSKLQSFVKEQAGLRIRILSIRIRKKVSIRILIWMRVKNDFS